MIAILLVVVVLVAWSLHLMQEALDTREFSLMLAGFLVATAAAALMAVYFLMGHYFVYMNDMPQQAQCPESMESVMTWVAEMDAAIASGYPQ